MSRRYLPDYGRLYRGSCSAARGSIMALQLIPHPDTPCLAVTGIDVTVARASATQVQLAYAIFGDISALAMPPAAPPVRTDRLWLHLCVEMFVRDAAGTGYSEFNFSPSGAWAAYGFDGYRAGMRDVPLATPPKIITQSNANEMWITVTLDARLPASARIALSAVIETKDGAKSYWALAHPLGKPDFHHADCFATQLTATGAA
jgi:hypothetical protein